MSTPVLHTDTHTKAGMCTCIGTHEHIGHTEIGKLDREKELNNFILQMILIKINLNLFACTVLSPYGGNSLISDQHFLSGFQTWLFTRLACKGAFQLSGLGASKTH